MRIDLDDVRRFELHNSIIGAGYRGTPAGHSKPRGDSATMDTCSATHVDFDLDAWGAARGITVLHSQDAERMIAAARASVEWTW
eukprot:COSAG02_NODE_3128_length_7315_cov_4.407844_2_plen_84_part_00